MSSQTKPGAKPFFAELSGLVFGRDRDGMPAVLRLGDTLQLPLFRNEAALGLFYYEILGPGVLFAERVEDPDAFLQSIPGEVEVVVEPHRNEDGRWEYTKVLRD